MGTIYLADNMDILPCLERASIDLIYIDPPFNTGKVQSRTQLRTVHDESEGDRIGFQGRRYKTERGATRAYDDRFDDFLGFLEPRLHEAFRLLKPHGSLFVHLDYREVHYCKVLLDQIFGRDCFINEIIWAYDFGGRSKKKWSAKHDNILWYAKDPNHYTFHFDQMERIPYMAPGLVGKEKAARGKTPTACWWHTIVPTNGKEKTGYPTQKPLGILNRVIQVHSNPGDLILDFFAGSGTTGEAAARLQRDFILIDQNPESVDVMMQRLAFASPTLHNTLPPNTTPKTNKAQATKPKAAKKTATKKPTAKKPTATKPTAKKPTAKKPTAKKPATKKPTATKPTATKPTAKKPATAPKSTAKKPVTKKNAAKKPAKNPVTTKPSAKKPATKKAAAAKPVAKKPVAKKPASKKPATKKSATTKLSTKKTTKT